VKSLSKITAQIVIGTPGRVIDAITHGKLKTAKIKIFVLDEADVMISTQGFQEQTTRIKKFAPSPFPTIVPPKLLVALQQIAQSMPDLPILGYLRRRRCQICSKDRP
jgi:superfamily II DNA/RNA helicase